MALVSVIVAAWNAEKTILRCVESIIAQRGVDVEAIVVNDCSTDSTAEKITDLVHRYPNVISVQTERNSGPSVARNRGLALARGEWIAIVDADDTIGSGRLAQMEEVARKKCADVCLDNLKIVLVNVKKPPISVLVQKKQAEALKGDWTVKSFTSFNRAYDSPVLTGFLKPLFRSSFIKANALGYNTNLSNGEDYLLLLECLICGAKVLYLDSPLYNYYVYKSSLSGIFNPEAHRKLIAAERALLEKFAPTLSAESKKDIEGHIDSLKLAGVTNEIFAAIRNRNCGALVRLFWKDRMNFWIHFKRVANSVARKLLNITGRGK
ncbi:MAG: glycosyltransferase family 2 protein [Bdellovibrionales bacterium]